MAKVYVYVKTQDRSASSGKSWWNWTTLGWDTSTRIAYSPNDVIENRKSPYCFWLISYFHHRGLASSRTREKKSTHLKNLNARSLWVHGTTLKTISKHHRSSMVRSKPSISDWILSAALLGSWSLLIDMSGFRLPVSGHCHAIVVSSSCGPVVMYYEYNLEVKTRNFKSDERISSSSGHGHRRSFTCVLKFKCPNTGQARS